MFKNLAVALLIGAVSADDVFDVVNDAISSPTVDALSDQEPGTIHGMTQVPQETNEAPSFAQGEGDGEDEKGKIPSDQKKAAAADAANKASAKAAAANANAASAKAANAASAKAATANANAKAAIEIKQNAIDAAETEKAATPLPENPVAVQKKPKSTTPAPPAAAPAKATSMYGGSYVTPTLTTAKWDHPAAVDYKVPNFGEDKDILATRKHIADSEKKLKHKWVVKKNDKSTPKDYFVPNLGLDRDIIESGKSIQVTEKRLKKKWNPKQDKDGQWIVPQPFDNKSYSYAS